MCKDCYEKGVKHRIDGFTGITTVEPCSCNKPKPHKQWLSDLITKLAEYNQMSEEQVKEYLGVTT